MTPELSLSPEYRQETLERAGFFQCLANPVRLCILQNLCKRETLCVSDFCSCMGCSQPLISKHLRALREAGLIRSRQEGTHVHYSLADERVCRVLAALKDA